MAGKLTNRKFLIVSMHYKKNRQQRHYIYNNIFFYIARTLAVPSALQQSMKHSKLNVIVRNINT